MYTGEIHLTSYIPSFRDTPIGPKGKPPHLANLITFVKDYTIQEIKQGKLSPARVSEVIDNCQRACKMATESVQRQKNKGGGELSHSPGFLKAVLGKEGRQLYYILLGVTKAGTGIDPSHDLNVLCRHRHESNNRKSNWFIIGASDSFEPNYTNHALQFNKIIEGELRKMVSQELTQLATDQTSNSLGLVGQPTTYSRA
jgi:hypothetical protein